MSPGYESYSVDDFLGDQHFIEWVKYQTPEAEAFWKSYIAQGPPNLSALRSAQEQLQWILSVPRIEPGPADAEQVWTKITGSINSAGTGGGSVVRNIRTWVLVAGIAASLVVTAAVWLFNQKTSIQTIAADYGHRKTVTLPDASVIKLNSNSTIQYLSTWDNNQPREVFLKGEAFFVVDHRNKNPDAITPGDRFVVHTDWLRVEVLGTSFNVKERRGKTEVSLETGSLKVQVKTDSTNKQLLLKPGELAVFDSNTQHLQKISHDPAFAKDWTENKMLTNNTTVADIVQELEDVYGYEVILSDTNLSSRRIDGTIPFRNESNVLFVLSNILDVEIEKKDNQVILKTRK